MVKKNSIPERWRSLTAIGTRVPGSRFIAFKVPLKGATNQRVTQTQKFTPKDLVTSIRNQNEELGLIVDLTNTERYYTTKDLPRSVKYVKLHTAGLKIPDDATVHQFKRLVRQFLFANEDNDKLIGVHCTTGINRTGYLICRYLIDVDGWRPLHSITAFANSRGHPIEGAVYIEDLIKGPMRSNVGIDLPPTEEEQRALNSGGDLLRDEQGNDFGDFDARDRRPMPPMRSDDCLDDFDARGARVAPRNILGDHDLRLPSLEPQNTHYIGDMEEPMYPPERLRRPGDFHPNMENFHDPTPRPLMSIPARAPREMQQPFEDPGMLNEGMDYDMRSRGRPMHAMQSQDFSSDMQYDDPSAHPLQMFPHNKMNNPAFEGEEEEEEEAEHIMNSELPYREGFIGNETPRFDPRGRGAMRGSFRGPVNERMQPRIARPMGGPMGERMNPRDSRLMAGPVSEDLHPFMDETMNERMYPREGSMNEHIPRRNTRPMNPQMGERGHPREAAYMEDTPYIEDSMNDQLNIRNARASKGFMNEKLHPQAIRSMEGPMNERMPQRGFRGMQGPMKNRAQLMKGPLSERIHPNPAQLVDYSMNERMDPRPGQNMEDPGYEEMQLNDPRAMGGPMNARMPQRGARSGPNSMGDRGYPGGTKAMDGSNNDHMYPRDGGDGMYPRPARPTESPMNRPYPTGARATDGSMNEWMPQGNARAMERPVNERMHPVPTRGPRPMDGSMHEDFARPYEARNINPSEESIRPPNRFAPYPPKKPLEAPELRGPHNMAPPAHPLGMPEMGGQFPPQRRSRFHY